MLLPFSDLFEKKKVGGGEEGPLQDEKLKYASLLKIAYYQLQAHFFDSGVMDGLSALHYSVVILVFSRL